MSAKPFMLKQLAIAMTANGEIGQDDDLLFTNERDLSNFAAFTANTVLIIGRKTADQMIDHGVYPTPTRPWVVLSKSQTAVKTPAGVETPWAKNLAYALTFNDGYTMARTMVELSPTLFGITFAGGAQIYEEVIARTAGSHNTALNSLYIHTCGSTAHSGNVVLSASADALCKLFAGKMHRPQQVVQSVGTNFRFNDGTAGVATGIHSWLYDADEYDPSRCKIIGPRGSKVQINTAEGDFTVIDLKEVAMYNLSKSADKMVITMKSGIKHDIRFEGLGRPALRHLEILINKYWSTNE